MTSIMKDFELVFGIRVTDTNRVISGYWIKTVISKGEKPNEFFIEGDLSHAVAHIKRRCKIVDIDRAEAFLKIMKEEMEDEDA